MALMALSQWLAATGKLPASYHEKTAKLLSMVGQPKRLPLNVVYYGWSMLMYLGLFLLPLSLPIVLSRGYRERYAGFRRLQFGAIGLFALAFMVRLVLSLLGRIPAPLMPVHNNVIIPQGIGPVILRDSPTRDLPNLPPLPFAFWLVVTVLSFVGAALLIMHLVLALVETGRNIRDALRSRRANRTAESYCTRFFLLAALIYLLPLLLSGFFDRYLLPVVGFGIALMVLACRDIELTWGRNRYVAPILLVAGFAVYGVSGTRDYLEWNRIRWRALDALLAQPAVTPQLVDGGFEFNGLYKFNTFTATNWWQVDDSYAVTFSKPEGFSVLKSYPYHSWLPPAHRKILVIKRDADRPGTARPAAPVRGN
jgi:hypothetical protein